MADTPSKRKQIDAVRDALSRAQTRKRELEREVKSRARDTANHPGRVAARHGVKGLSFGVWTRKRGMSGLETTRSRVADSNAERASQLRRVRKSINKFRARLRELQDS